MLNVIAPERPLGEAFDQNSSSDLRNGPAFVWGNRVDAFVRNKMNNLLIILPGHLGQSIQQKLHTVVKVWFHDRFHSRKVPAIRCCPPLLPWSVPVSIDEMSVVGPPAKPSLHHNCSFWKDWCGQFLSPCLPPGFFAECQHVLLCWVPCPCFLEGLSSLFGGNQNGLNLWGWLRCGVANVQEVKLCGDHLIRQMGKINGVVLVINHLKINENTLAKSTVLSLYSVKVLTCVKVLSCQ